ncbi:hypothetical protein [Mesorhizobium sp. B1-1-7]|uniref:hypothetical protein n=1 Tax=Mesorhizobium sp. B1-1-7 TaxID=2589977 RepID=UPI00112676C5|nr:hypothetical protein [Mesorhizobium sp. B1-1-7]TPN43235.1 hypothetical protein FJ978_31535 [Mesorhizobium sp. B1-1-7]
MSNADLLIAEAAKSPQHEAWITRQLIAQRRPSEILADLRRAIDPAKLIAEAGGDGPAGLTVACLVMFALPFVLLGWVLPS